MSKIEPNFSNFLLKLKIGPELVVMPLDGHRKCIYGKKLQWDDFV